MSLLIDENLSTRLPRALQDIFPGSRHVGEVGLDSTEDDEKTMKFGPTLKPTAWQLLPKTKTTTN